jgi:hypothetical protein
VEGPTQAAAAQSPLSLGGHRPAGWRGRQGTRRRAAAWAPLNSLSAPPPGALPGKPLLPAPLQTAGPRRRGVTEAAAGRVRRAGRRWVGRWRGAGRAGFHQVSRPRSRRRRCHRRCHHHRHRFSAGERANDSPAAVLSASSTSGAVVAAAPSRSRQVRGRGGGDDGAVPGRPRVLLGRLGFACRRSAVQDMAWAPPEPGPGGRRAGTLVGGW